jgi:hypothetical protein
MLSPLVHVAFTASALAAATRASRNPYLPVSAAGADGKLRLNDLGLVKVRRADDLMRPVAIPAGTPDVLNTTHAAALARSLSAKAGRLELVSAGFVQ